MSGGFSEQHVGKRVVAQNGTEVGTVTEVRDGTLFVEVSADADEDVISELRWDGLVQREEQDLPNEFVSTVTDETIRLRV